MALSKRILTLILTFLLSGSLLAKEIPLVANIYARQHMTLNGKWNYIVDPLENGYYDYRLQPHTKGGFFENKKPKSPSDLVEYSFDASPVMDIPGDWNMQNPQLFFYEGTVWFKKDFQFKKQSGTKNILYFGAVNYDAKVYVNGELVGAHVGGYTPFNFDITDVLNDGENFVVVKVDNKRGKDFVPTQNFDWWNYGGITRDVLLASVPDTFVEDYTVQLKKGSANTIPGWIKLNTATAAQSVTVEIPELKVKQTLTTNAEGKASFELTANPILWSPENPKLYEVVITAKGEVIKDNIGFRNIETKGREILLNGKKIFLRGVSIHEEAPYARGRAHSVEDATTLLTWAKQMGCNYVRLAHYPHSENMVRQAEKMGIMVWSEIPVYWTISWENEATYANAQQQLHDMIRRDKNRSAVIIWSIANETPHSEPRDRFLGKLATYARKQDDTRLISMAMEVTKDANNLNRLEDNMNTFVDVISFNQYIGWYRASNEDARKMKWEVPYNKPVIISEFGGEALQGLHGDKTAKWNEEYQEELYIRNLEMLEKIDGLSGLSPWILVDFRSPRRQLPNIQDFFNRKGLISSWGIKKKAFFVMQDYYNKKTEQYK
ncbi:glycoside hydrolase family 2 protein [Filimonas effusa]|uniref:Beta-glucuronidase n=1 Tax=Filimonas effusa TaxID=2508721 RepID=A0A4Q1DBQ1_9BACT|nr:glycoside hydrolase family 2 TIM barrel-domain containing protein [Filimonas effusa]RXK86215.1 beta-glucuronidase [Filimonas effusa]